MKIPEKTAVRQVAILSLMSLILVGYHMILNRSVELWYLPWNLFLAWVPLGLALVAIRASLPSWGRALAIIAWLAFLPNAFYILTDIIHIGDTTRFSQTYDALVFCTTLAAGYAAGLISLRIIDRYFFKKYSRHLRLSALVATALLCSIAIYIGRILRWNSWDLIVHPWNVLVDTMRIFTMQRTTAEFALIILMYSIVILMIYWLVYPTRDD
jgi:uncharacterized membrane protein